MKILVTGSQGLVGTALAPLLSARGHTVVPFDVVRSPKEDVCDAAALAAAARDVGGIIHLAAVSRVIWGERDPERCRRVNEGSVEAIAGIVRERKGAAPWVLFASSREVYGEQHELPVREDAELRPLNIYARTKVHGETEIGRLAGEGFVANVVRFSNVFGSVHDHRDRVVPAFARAAALGGEIRIEGGRNTFDFTYVHDVVRGLARLVELTASGQVLDPIHLVTGKPTTLTELAELARRHARREVSIHEAPPRSFDVSRFYGSPERAAAVLGWRAETPLEEGFARLVADFAAERDRSAA